GLAGTDPPPVDAQREVIGHVGQPAVVLVDLEDHDTILVDRPFPFPIHGIPLAVVTCGRRGYVADKGVLLTLRAVERTEGSSAAVGVPPGSRQPTDVVAGVGRRTRPRSSLLTTQDADGTDPW